MYHELQYQLSLRAAFDKDSQSQADSATVNVPSETIICRPCMRRFEKLKKLRNELSVNENSIQSQLRVAAALMPKTQGKATL